MAKDEKWPRSGLIEPERQNVPGRPVIMIALGSAHAAEEAGEDDKGRPMKGGKTCPTCGGKGTC